MVAAHGIETLVEQLRLFHARFPFHHLKHSFVAEADVDRVSQGIDEISHFETRRREQLGAIAADVSVRPEAIGIVAHGKDGFPIALKARLRVDIHVRNGNFEVTRDARPQVDVLLVVVGAEAEAADHLEEREMRAIADRVDVAGADAVLHVAVTGAVPRLESGFEWLHPRADEEGGRIVLGDYVGVDVERKTVLVEPTAKGLI